MTKCRLNTCPKPAVEVLYQQPLCERHARNYKGMPKALARRIMEQEWYECHSSSITPDFIKRRGIGG
jgi:hypothetical protein